MVEVICGIDAHARRVGIGDDAENVTGARAVAVGIRDCLKGNGAGRQDQVEAAGGDLARDRVGRADVALGIVTTNREVLAVLITPGRQRLEHPVDALIEDEQRGMLHERDACFRLGATLGFCGAARSLVGVEQHARRQRQQAYSQRKSLQDFKHGRVGFGLAFPARGAGVPAESDGSRA